MQVPFCSCVVLSSIGLIIPNRVAIEFDAQARSGGNRCKRRLQLERLSEQIVLANQPAEDIGWPRAARGGGTLVEIHGFENAQVDLRAVPTRQAGGRRDSIELLEADEAAVEVEAIDGVKLKGTNRVVHALTVIDVGKRDMQDNRD